VELPSRSATRKSAPSAGGPASTQAIAVAADSPAAGAEIDAACDGAGERLGDAAGELAVGAAACDRVIGVSSAGPGFPAGTVEQPATSTDVATTRAIRMRSG
jgi:hypothetical protein